MVSGITGNTTRFAPEAGIRKLDDVGVEFRWNKLSLSEAVGSESTEQEGIFCLDKKRSFG